MVLIMRLLISPCRGGYPEPQEPKLKILNPRHLNSKPSTQWQETNARRQHEEADVHVLRMIREISRS